VDGKRGTVTGDLSDRGADPAIGEPSVDFEQFVASSADMNAVATLEGVYCYVSPASRRIFGWHPSQLEGRAENEFVHPDDLAAVVAGRMDLDSDFVTVTYRFVCADGSYRWVETTSRAVDSRLSRLVASTVRDVTLRQEHDTRLQLQALTDPLTGVANRTVLMDRLHQALRRMQRTVGVLAVLYLDLDRFKVINDSLGHRIGDQVLLDMAERLSGHVRPADTLARLGGDEFVIVAEAMSSQEAALDLAERILQAGREPFRIGDESFVCTLSVGIAWTADSQRNSDELLREADLALYRAKDRGRDRSELFDEELRINAIHRMETERTLRRSITEHRLVVEYQPVIDLRAGRYVGAEALVRIDDPDRGLLKPESFLAVAQETGLLIVIDEHVLADAVTQARAWHDRFPDAGFSDVAINVTARHLADPHFPAAVIEQLDAAHIEHRHLQVEVTEQVLMEASKSAMTGLRALRNAGIQVGLDDFGTGYSSLSYLRQFPLDFVKIDQSFIHDLDHGNTQTAIVAAIIGLSHALGLTVVAEGVETPSQLATLRALDCDRAQGFLFAKSTHPDNLTQLISAGLNPIYQSDRRGVKRRSTTPGLC
jgi:diguanylate cyclase (GGDEF)-like protein/PAS domain S-box-containing protein